jgi:hypothetical protein
MQHRTRNVLTAVLASCLLAAVGFGSVVAAHGPIGGHPGIPGSSARPLPSGWAWPSDLPTLKPHVPLKTPDPAKTSKPEPTKAQQPEPTKAPKPVLSCAPTPGSSATPVPSVAPTAAPAAFQLKGKLPGFGADWGKLTSDLSIRFNDAWTKVYCQIDPLRAALDKQISGRISSLQDVITKTGKSGLGASDLAIVDSELNSLIADLNALKGKVDAETTLASLQADLQTFNANTKLFGTATQWVQLLVGAEKLIASEPDLATLQAKVAAEVAGAPAGPETADAQLYVNNMNLAIAAGKSLVAPLPAMLLAITPAQLADGSADATLTSARATLFRATWDFQLARWSAQWAEHEVTEASATPTPAATPVATPAATPTPV